MKIGVVEQHMDNKVETHLLNELPPDVHIDQLNLVSDAAVHNVYIVIMGQLFNHLHKNIDRTYNCWVVLKTQISKVIRNYLSLYTGIG